jgi:DNA-directed RNA polymerase specialized sigma24 family protein
VARNIPRHIAEELANDTLVVVYQSYDPARGALKSFCSRVLLNKIRNYVKTIPPTDEIFDDDVFGIFENPETLMLKREKAENIRRFLSILMENLSTQERRFLMKYAETLDEMKSRAVLETARRMGLPESEGTAIIKRIARKAKNLREDAARQHRIVKLSKRVADIEANDYALSVKPSLDRAYFEDRPGSLINQERIAEPSMEESLVFGIVSVQDDLSAVSFNGFWSHLSENERSRLASFF